MKTIAELLDRHAPMNRVYDGIEKQTVDRLMMRLGIDHEALMALIQAGILCPFGGPRGSGDAAEFPFKTSSLNELKRALLSAALVSLAEEMDLDDSPDMERRFVQAADFLLCQNRDDMRKRGNRANDEETKRRRGEANIELRRAARSGSAREFSSAGPTEKSVIHVLGARLVGIEFDGQPLTGKLAADRYRKKIRDDDESRRDANLLRSGALGAAAGVLAPARGLAPGRRAILGGILGAGSVLAVRRATEGTKDMYGDRSREAKQVEGAVPFVAGAAATGIAAARLSEVVRQIMRRTATSKFSETARSVFLNALAREGHHERKLFLADARAAGFSFDEKRAQSSHYVFFGVAGSVFDHVLKMIRSGAINLRTPGTTLNGAARGALKGVGVGAAIGAGSAVVDGDPETGLLGGGARGAAVGAGIGAGVGALRGMSPGGKGWLRRIATGRP
ncbi:MAG TPA: hypothetical protein VIM61_01375 [Chthoniobacterales bacterium]